MSRDWEDAFEIEGTDTLAPIEREHNHEAC